MPLAAIPTRKGMYFGLLVAGVYFAAVTILAIVAACDPEGSVTESGAWAFTLPTAWLAGLMLRFASAAAITICTATLNAVILYIVAGAVASKAGFAKATG